MIEDYSYIMKEKIADMGLILEGKNMRYLSEEEYGFWLLNPLPPGCVIPVKPRKYREKIKDD